MKEFINSIFGFREIIGTMITNTESRILNQIANPEMQYDTLLPEIEIKLKYKCFGKNFGVYSICTDTLSPGAIVYSIGVGKDISFESELNQSVTCELHLFDPTPASIAWINRQILPENYFFHPYAASAIDQSIYLYPPLNPNRTSHSIVKHKWASDNPIMAPAKSLNTITAELNHHQIDVLKMDIEGAEYEIINSLSTIEIRPKQIIVEFHHHYPEIGSLKTKNAISQLRRMGYKLFACSEKLEEFSFILDK